MAEITDPAYTGKDFDVTDPNQLTAKRINTYIVDCLEVYEMSGNIDNLLFDDFQLDFIGWDEPMFKLADKTLRATLKNYLKDHGVYMANSGLVSAQCFSLLEQTEYPEWPEKEVEKYRNAKKGKFKSRRYNPSFDEPNTETKGESVKKSSKRGKSTTSKSAKRTTRVTSKPTEEPTEAATAADADPGDGSGSDLSSSDESDGGGTIDPDDLADGKDDKKDPIEEITRDFKKAEFAPKAAMTTSKVLTDLGKLYYNDSNKFGGELYDILDAKLKIFRDLCTKAGVPQGLYPQAYSTMLKGRAQQFYYDHIAESDPNLTFDEMVSQTKAFFHTSENRQLYLQEWRATTLLSTIQGNIDKDLSQCLEIVIDKLQKVHKGLSYDYKTDYNLAEQLMSACQGVEACTPVLINPATTFESVASDLRSAVGMYMRCKREVPKVYNTTNRRYDRPERYGFCYPGG